MFTQTAEKCLEMPQKKNFGVLNCDRTIQCHKVIRLVFLDTLMFTPPMPLVSNTRSSFHYSSNNNINNNNNNNSNNNNNNNNNK